MCISLEPTSSMEMKEWPLWTSLVVILLDDNDLIVAHIYKCF